LDVGMNFHDYGAAVADLQVAHDHVIQSSLRNDCLTKVWGHMEDALTAYSSAESTWNTCITDINCNTDSITPELQTSWSEAGSAISDADLGLQALALKPAPSPSP